VCDSVARIGLDAREASLCQRGRGGSKLARNNCLRFQVRAKCGDALSGCGQGTYRAGRTPARCRAALSPVLRLIVSGCVHDSVFATIREVDGGQRGTRRATGIAKMRELGCSMLAKGSSIFRNIVSRAIARCCGEREATTEAHNPYANVGLFPVVCRDERRSFLLWARGRVSSMPPEPSGGL